MKFDAQKHNRRSIRLKGFDYAAAGAYFVTICAYQRQSIFGEVQDGVMVPNARGQIVRREWFRTAELRAYVELAEDEFVVMPNHVHGIIRIVGLRENVGALRGNARYRAEARAEQRSAPTNIVAPGTLGAIVRAYKAAVTYAINTLEHARGAVVWQRNYYEHIVRDEGEWNSIGWYIVNNPRNWQLDRDNEQNTRQRLPPETASEYYQDVEETIGIKT